ncbi:MAG: hypothetical protein AYK19_12660 [Theionarchaea archaeon DG-70-1]|nr:MAG: hypothetical protein AYK19_12660 [Theionarchaea archaeon DG-70-1]
MALFKQLVLKGSIEIKTSPEKIWEFFTNLEQNYTTWHPEDHIMFQWTKGNPMEEGSHFYAEQYVMGKVTKYKGTLGEVIPNRKIVFKMSFPISLGSPKFEWQIEPKGSNSVFIDITYMRFERFYRTFYKKGMERLIEVHDKHTGEERENLKKILEK